ncbi:hypothetical protein BH18GEM1_BH18GEM1_06900 [soil metagenome]
MRRFRRTLGELSFALEAAARAGLDVLGSASSKNGPTQRREVETVTGDHYGKLFRAFNDQSYWNEPTQLLRTRLERNGVTLKHMAMGEILDAGCGGGRYTVAWRLLGARLVIGVDFSELGISDACQRLAPAGIGQVRFIRGNVLALPFPSDRFDVVFSNGVLHHTLDWKSGVEEVLRVLRPGGFGWLYLIERPGGLFWDMIEILRVLMAGESREVARTALVTIGIPANRIFYMLDHVLVPINVRLAPDEVEAALASAGASDVRRLERGADFDRVERIHRGYPFARMHYGVGENRYVFSKP